MREHYKQAYVIKVMLIIINNVVLLYYTHSTIINHSNCIFLFIHLLFQFKENNIF